MAPTLQSYCSLYEQVKEEGPHAIWMQRRDVWIRQGTERRSISLLEVLESILELPRSHARYARQVVSSFARVGSLYCSCE